MKVRQLSRLGVVQEISEGCATIEVSVPCGGCSQSGCAGRRSAGRIELAAAAWQPGDEINLSLPVSRLTTASLATFGLPTAWLAGSVLMLASFPDSGHVLTGFGPVLIGCGMVGALTLGGWLGRRASRSLRSAMTAQRLAAVRSGESAESAESGEYDFSR
jgi:hypothetical protein